MIPLSLIDLVVDPNSQMHGTYLDIMMIRTSSTHQLPTYLALLKSLITHGANNIINSTKLTHRVEDPYLNTPIKFRRWVLDHPLTHLHNEGERE